MSKACARHPDREPVALCRRCQKPVCKSCLLVTPQGHVCSSECSLLLRTVEEEKRDRPRKRESKLGKILVVVFAVLIAICLASVLAGFVFSDRLRDLFLKYQ